MFLFAGGPHVATSRRLTDVDASAGAPALRRVDRGGLRARAEDHHSGLSTWISPSTNAQHSIRPLLHTPYPGIPFCALSVFVQYIGITAVGKRAGR